MLQVQCPNCQTGYSLKEEFAGRQATCRSCKKSFTVAAPVPAGAGAARPAAAPPPPPAARPAMPAPPPARAAAATAAIPKAPAAPPPPPPRPPGANAPGSPAPARPAAAPPPVPPKPPAPVAKAPAPVPASPARPPGAHAPGSPSAPGSPAAPAPGPTIDFNCPFCEAALKLPVDLESKQAPCPECKRIIKVPARVKSEPLDWRKGEGRQTGGSLKKDVQAAPQGAWDATAATVSKEALIEAEAIPRARTERSLGYWLTRAVLAFVVVVGLGLLWTTVSNYFSDKAQNQALALALAFVPEGKAPEIPPLAAAEVHRSAGEFERRAGHKVEARKHLGAASGFALALKQVTPDRDAFLIDVAAQQAYLILTQQEIQDSRSKRDADNEQRQATMDLKATLSQIQAVEAQSEALRQVTRILLGKQQAEMAVGLAAGLRQPAEQIAVVGLEFLKAGQGDPKKAAEFAHKQPASGVAPSQVALLLALKETAKVEEIAPRDGNWVAGSAEGFARGGELEQARNLLAANAPRDPLDHLRGLARLGCAVLETNPKDATELQKALVVAEKLAAEDRLNVIETGKPNLSWSMLRLVQAAAAAGHGEEAGKLAALIPDPALKGRGQLAVLRAKLAASTSSADDKLADDIDAKVEAHPLARQAIARHNARFGSSGGVLDAIRGWTPEAHRAYGYAGATLGVQDR